jgi:hypothetical protein
VYLPNQSPPSARGGRRRHRSGLDASPSGLRPAAMEDEYGAGEADEEEEAGEEAESYESDESTESTESAGAEESAEAYDMHDINE